MKTPKAISGFVLDISVNIIRNGSASVYLLYFVVCFFLKKTLIAFAFIDGGPKKSKVTTAIRLTHTR